MRGFMFKRTVLLIALVLGISTLVAGTASADNPPCPTYFATAVINVQGDHFRGKACYRESTDNWQFQDTYADTQSTEFRYPENDLSGLDYGYDTNGANNGWNTKYSEYPENRELAPQVCAYNKSTWVYYGCTSTSVMYS